MRQKEKISASGGNRQHQEQGRENAPDSPLVKAGRRKGALAKVREDDPCDEIARDHKEDVDANEAAGAKKADVAENDGHNGQRSKTFNVSPVGR